MQATLEAVLSSRSWRVTRFPRRLAREWRSLAMRRVLRRIRRRVRRQRAWHEERFVLGMPSAEERTGDVSHHAPVAVCAIVHAYYIDLLPEIVQRLLHCSELRRAIVTYPEDRDAGLYFRSLEPLRALGVVVELVPVENRGRDMLPLVRVAQRALDSGCTAFLKVHTKRSPHLGHEGSMWRQELLDGLIGDTRAASAAARVIAEDPNFGFAVPASRLGGRVHRGRNGKRVRQLARRAGLRVPRTVLFPAGGMYWCSRDWLEALVRLGLAPDDFEQEAGQLDGTTAHALERLIGCFAWTRRATVWLMEAG